MGKFILRRLIQSIPTLLGITVIVYFVMSFAPGGPVNALAFDPTITPQQRTAMAEAMGVNDPFHVQYIRWMIGDAPIRILGIQLWEGRQLELFDRRGFPTGETVTGTAKGILRGDFGRSLVSRQAVTQAIWVRVPPSFELGMISLLVGIFIGIPVGVLAAVYQGSLFDQVTRIMAVIVSAIPVFWLGLILLLVFGSWLGWLPMGNRFPIRFSGNYTFWERIQHLILPVFTLSSFSIATFSRFMRASLLDVLGQDYVRTARAKGLSDRKVWFKHALRNALIPIATILGPSLTLVISGAVLTETIYAWPGMGRLLVDSVTQQDYPVIMGIVLLLAILTILGYLLSDILYAVFDPRIRLS